MTLKRIKINFGWAFIYNLVLVPIAMGLLYPLGAKSTADGVGEGSAGL